MKQTREEKLKKRAERRARRKERVKLKKTKNRILYVLRLEDNCWYVGSTSNIYSRFKQHQEQNGRGSKWTELHRPIEIYETRKIGITTESEAAKYEDIVTLEYMNKYGKEYVRGGGRCQINLR